MRLRILIPFILLLFMAACGEGTKTFTGSQIDSTLRETIKGKNNRLIEGLNTNSNNILHGLITEDFRKKYHAKLNKVIWFFRHGDMDGSYKVYEEFHTIHTGAPTNYVLESEKGFEFTFQRNQPQSYISLLRVENNMESYLIAVVYEFVENDWKINDIFAGMFAVYGKDAQEYYALAKKQAKKGYTVDALNFVDIAEELTDPANGHLKFDNADKMQLAKKIWKKEVYSTYQFPISLSADTKSPRILGISPIRNRYGFTYVFNYATSIPLTSETVLAQECDQVKKAVKKHFKKLDFNKPIMYYRAYQPDMETFSTFEDVR
jgi:hypothetical protein